MARVMHAAYEPRTWPPPLTISAISDCTPQMWVWSAATLRVVTANSTLTCSAVYFTKRFSGPEYVVAVGPPVSELSTEVKELCLNIEQSGASEETMWDEVQLAAVLDAAGLAEVTERLRGSFDLQPPQQTQVAVLTFTHPDNDRRKLAKREFAIESKISELHRRQILTYSSPFAAVNYSLFSGYVSTGTISYLHTPRSSSNSPPDIVFADTRYLDGMEGGMVTIKRRSGSPGPCVGVVTGCLIKKGGEGRLTVILPWIEVLNLVDAAQKNGGKSARILDDLRQVLHSAVTAGAGPRPLSEHQNNFSGVVVIQSRLKSGKRVWGSGVLVEKDIVVTNRHVVGDYKEIEVWFEKYDRKTIVAVAHPLSGVDLVFLRLSKHVPGKYEPVKLAAFDPGTGTKVYSVGFGLFYPETLGPALQPLYSEGIIAKRQLGMLKQVPQSEQAFMLISTAGCWNGSSGGALFDHSQRLVGIMASNARDEATGEIMPDMSFVIPVGILAEALALLKMADQSETPESFQNLWKLQRTHVDARRRLRAKV